MRVYVAWRCVFYGYVRDGDLRGWFSSHFGLSGFFCVDSGVGMVVVQCSALAYNMGSMVL